MAKDFCFGTEETKAKGLCFGTEIQRWQRVRFGADLITSFLGIEVLPQSFPLGPHACIAYSEPCMSQAAAGPNTRE